MLPSVLKNCNIYTYDWNAAYVGDVSGDILLGHADSLLNNLYITRKQAVWIGQSYSAYEES